MCTQKFLKTLAVVVGARNALQSITRLRPTLRHQSRVANLLAGQRNLDSWGKKSKIKYGPRTLQPPCLGSRGYYLQRGCSGAGRRASEGEEQRE